MSRYINATLVKDEKIINRNNKLTKVIYEANSDSSHMLGNDRTCLVSADIVDNDIEKVRNFLLKNKCIVLSWKFLPAQNVYHMRVSSPYLGYSDDVITL